MYICSKSEGRRRTAVLYQSVNSLLNGALLMSGDGGGWGVIGCDDER
jgi:hypothetical protein